MIIKVENNQIWLHGRIWSGDEIYFESNYSKVERSYSDIEIHVHGIGGDVFAGNYMISRIRSSSANVRLKVDGIAFSMFAYLLMAGNKVSMVSNGFIMTHQAQGGTHGTAKDHRTTAGLLDDMNENFIKDLIKKTGKTRKKVLELFFDGDNYFNAKKSLEIGLIDEILDPVINIEIDEAQAIANPELFGQFNALLAKPGKKEKLKPQISMKSEIIEKYKLTGVNANSSNTAVFEALERSFEGVNKTADYNALKKEYDELRTKVDQEKNSQIEALLKPFEGKLDKTKIETYKAIGEKSGIEALTLSLEGLQPRKNVLDMIIGKESQATSALKDGWDWDKYQNEDPRALERIAENEPDAYLALGKAKYGEGFTV